MTTGHTNILAIGRNEEIMTVMQRLLNAPEDWSGQAVTTDEAAFEALQATAYDIILLCAGITAEEETALRERLSALAPAAIITRHYGGGSGLLRNEILYLLEKR
jgi:BarA-like signal transduction histidine kinase